jgi:hypothetical protein
MRKRVRLLKKGTMNWFGYQVKSFTVVFRIRDILVRIRILGPAPLTNGSGFSRLPALFVSDLQGANKK